MIYKYTVFHITNWLCESIHGISEPLTSVISYVTRRAAKEQITGRLYHLQGRIPQLGQRAATTTRSDDTANMMELYIL